MTHRGRTHAGRSAPGLRRLRPRAGLLQAAHQRRRGEPEQGEERREDQPAGRRRADDQGGHQPRPGELLEPAPRENTARSSPCRRAGASPKHRPQLTDAWYTSPPPEAVLYGPDP
ncbi:hypothetical protein ACWGIU_10465 [Streptomyces sp. NPDC054840]